MNDREFRQLTEQDPSTAGCFAMIMFIILASILAISLANFEQRLSTIEAKLGLHSTTGWETIMRKVK